MKKLLSILFVVIFCLSLCACGNSANSTPADIVNDDGNIVQMSVNDLIDIYNENEAKFKSYKGNDISFVGTVKKVESDFRRTGDSFSTDTIIFEEGWEVIILVGDYNGLASKLSAGDKVSVSSQIYSCNGNKVEIVGMNGNYYDRRSIRDSVLEKVE